VVLSRPWGDLANRGQVARHLPTLLTTHNLDDVFEVFREVAEHVRSRLTWVVGPKDEGG
jgi:hypothetical protein